MTRTNDAASLVSLRAEFMLDADLARLLALNSALEAARVGRNGAAVVGAACKTGSIIIGAMASHGEAVALLSQTLEACRIPTDTGRAQVVPGH